MIAADNVFFLVVTAALSPAEITLIVIGLFAAILVVVIVRVVTHDRRIRRVRLGVFYERDRDEDEKP